MCHKLDAIEASRETLHLIGQRVYWRRTPTIFYLHLCILDALSMQTVSTATYSFA